MIDCMNIESGKNVLSIEQHSNQCFVLVVLVVLLVLVISVVFVIWV